MEGTPKKIYIGMSVTGILVGFTIVLFGQLILPQLKTNCNPNYSACVPDVQYDLNCPEIGHQVTVKGNDVFHLDKDGDGIGCEAYGAGNIFWQLVIFGFAGWFIGAFLGVLAGTFYESYENKRSLK